MPKEQKQPEKPIDSNKTVEAPKPAAPQQSLASVEDPPVEDEPQSTDAFDLMADFITDGNKDASVKPLVTKASEPEA